MTLEENVPLASLTTLRVGGAARYVRTCESVDEVRAALAFAREMRLPYYVLGGGSNVLASDEGYAGVVIRPALRGIKFTDDGERTLVAAGAGESWDALVDAAVERGLWGIENLAGIPGTVGAAPVQNIGAYGAELADTLVSVDAYNAEADEHATLLREECGLGYRESRFKQEPHLIILHVTLSLANRGAPNLTYKDLASRPDRDSLATPADVARVVREIRSRKFPSLDEYGTAGSFFKNAIVSEDAYEALVVRYPGMPGYAVPGGRKLSTAWMLDTILALRGYRKEHAWLYDKQPLVVVADDGATAEEVDALAKDVETRVHEATGITLEREVRMMPVK